MESKRVINDKLCFDEIFNISKKTICRWLKRGIDYKKKPGRKIFSDKYEWMIKDRALILHKQIGCVQWIDILKISKSLKRENGGRKKFPCSKGWLDKFMRRNTDFMNELLCKDPNHHKVKNSIDFISPDNKDNLI